MPSRCEARGLYFVWRYGIRNLSALKKRNPRASQREGFHFNQLVAFYKSLSFFGII